MRYKRKRNLKVYRIEDMKQGWFVGDFLPTAFKTNKCEVAYKRHRKNENWPRHAQKKAWEINYLITGEMRINDKDLEAGDIFVIPPQEFSKPTFFTNCQLIVVKIPSLPKDKILE